MKEYEVKVEKTDECVRISWDEDAPFCGADIDRNGNIALEPKEGTEGTFIYKLVGDIEYVKSHFNLNG